MAHTAYLLNTVHREAIIRLSTLFVGPPVVPIFLVFCICFWLHIVYDVLGYHFVVARFTIGWWWEVRLKVMGLVVNIGVLIESGERNY